MSETTSNITIFSLVFSFLFILSFFVNLSKANRSRQFIFVFIAVLYTVFVMLFYDTINNWILILFLWLSNFIYSLHDIHTSEWFNFINNIVFVLSFLILKAILLPVIHYIWRPSSSLFIKTSSLIYKFSEKLNLWVLKDEFAQAKYLWRGFYFTGIAISIALITITKLNPDFLLFTLPILPALVIIIIGELLFYFSGLTEKETIEYINGSTKQIYYGDFEDDRQGDDFSKIANYSLFRRKYAKMFKDRMLYDCIGANLIDRTSFGFLDDMKDNKNTLDVIISDYFSYLKEKGHIIDPGFILSTIELIHGRSVLINTPFYHDITNYVVMPIVRKLLIYKKVLVVVGRDSITQEVNDWLYTSIGMFCGIAQLWKTDVLTEDKPNCDVGVLSFADVYNFKLIKKNEDFLKEVGLVLVIEPSRIISTGQIGLSLIVDALWKYNQNMVYCCIDRNCDGLVDTLSHIFKINMTNVFATVPTEGVPSIVYWNPHGKFLHHKLISGVSRYLGMGSELSFLALSSKIPFTYWVSNEKFPIVDMKWIIGQYYKDICRYLGYPESQEVLTDKFKIDTNLWNLKVEKHSFITVEDEFNNLFELGRLYSTRGSRQCFVNVISENYLLRDYMIGEFVDVIRDISDDETDKENSTGRKFYNAEIFSTDAKAIPTFVADYANTERNLVFSIIMLMFGHEISEYDLKHKLSLAGISFKEHYDKFRELVYKHSPIGNISISSQYRVEFKGVDKQMIDMVYYRINKDYSALSDFAHNLSNAFFIVEDEKDKHNYLGTMLFDQVYQKFLPWQFITHKGKYYQIKTINKENGVVLKRAGDHIADRICYRQNREYTLSGFIPDSSMGACRTNRGFKIFSGYSNITVKTNGYYELTSRDNIANAVPVSLNNIPTREYKNKSIICLKFYDTNGNPVNENIHFTITVLLNELFVTMYPESYHYLVASMKNFDESNISKLIFPVEFIDFKDDNAIYIFEDCQIDLGLLLSLSRNINRITEIITDYLTWHQEKKSTNKSHNNGVAEEDDIQDIDENEETEDNVNTYQKYTKKDYLLFGYNEYDKKLDINGTLELLKSHLYNDNYLEQARKNINVAKSIPEDYFNDTDAHYCDFCAVKIDAYFELLRDGRERCDACSTSKLNTVEQFYRLYEIARRNMETFFGFRFNDNPIGICMINAREMADKLGYVFKATPAYDPRPVALAVASENTIYVESGAPKIVALSNIVHELTHIWQYNNWDHNLIKQLYEKKNELIVYEGMAVWAEVQFMYMMNETTFAKRKDLHFENCFNNIDKVSDGYKPYVLGYKEYKKQYPLKDEPTLLIVTPFTKNPPLHLPLDFPIDGVYGSNNDGTDNDNSDEEIQCDYCGKFVKKGQFDVTKDGCQRCKECKKTGINSLITFNKIYYEVRNKINKLFDIKINVPIKVRTANAKQMAELRGKQFIPTNSFDKRSPAFATSSSKGYYMYFEKGFQKIDVIASIVHELTHIWQFVNWNWTDLKNEYGEDDYKIVAEGMAVWATIQYLTFIKEHERAKKEENYILKLDDEYGWGYKNYINVFSIVDNPNNLVDSPFKTKVWPEDNPVWPIKKPLEKNKEEEVENEESENPTP